MYKVLFQEFANDARLRNQPTKHFIMCADLDRALALAGILQKMNTDMVQYSKIEIYPLNENDYETKKK